MIDFSKFYGDLHFVAALYNNKFLTDTDIQQVANTLIDLKAEPMLVAISVSNSCNIKELFETYLKQQHIQIIDSKRELTKSIFSYVLAGKIDMTPAMEFINFNISEADKVKEYVGDDIGVERILGNFWLIEDGDLCDDDFKKLTETINKDMCAYIQKN